jgi:hypothetical protein
VSHPCFTRRRKLPQRQTRTIYILYRSANPQQGLLVHTIGMFSSACNEKPPHLKKSQNIHCRASSKVRAPTRNPLSPRPKINWYLVYEVHGGHALCNYQSQETCFSCFFCDLHLHQSVSTHSSLVCALTVLPQCYHNPAPLSSSAKTSVVPLSETPVSAVMNNDY